MWSYGVCADRVDLGTDLSYTPGWLSPDGPPITPLKTNLDQSFIGRLNRAVVAFRAIVQVLDSYVPNVKLRYLAKLRESQTNLWFDILKLSLSDKMEEFLKLDFCTLMAYGTQKSTNRSIFVFSGFIRKLILTRASRMWNKGKSGREAAAFIRSLYESKRCWNEMSDELRNEAMETHKGYLGTPKECSDEAKLWIRRAVNMVVRPRTQYRPTGRCVPTWSASFEHTKRSGGNHSGVLGCGKELEIQNFGAGKQYSDDLTYRLLCEANELGNDVRFQALPEPGKFRVITVGREALYSSFRDFQRFLIDQWKGCPFGTMEADVLFKILQLRKDEIEGDFYWSGDYSSATDRLSIDATLECVDYLLKKVGIRSTLLGDTIYRSFRDCTIHYPDGTTVEQVRGQLMGHPLSFVILCIINLSTYLRACNIRSRRDHRLKNVIINGDDILFKGYRECGLGLRWREAAEDVGLHVNEMKTYESSRWALINSIFVDMDNGEEIRYLPLSVSLGHNIKRGECTKTIGQGAQIFDLASRVVNDRGRRLCQRLVLKTLTRLTPRVGDFVPNFFVHKDLGGFGLQAPEGWKFGISDLQRKVATFFSKNRTFRAVRETISVMPVAVKRALQKLGKLTPVSSPWLLKGKPVLGPVLPNECITSYLQDLLPVVLKSTAWVVGPGEDQEYFLLHQYRKALKSREIGFRTKKMLNYFPAREVVWLRRESGQCQEDTSAQNLEEE